jgi:hypothetical protein
MNRPPGAGRRARIRRNAADGRLLLSKRTRERPNRLASVLFRERTIMNEPIFSFIPIVIENRDAVDRVTLTLRGVSTRHESRNTDQGRLYGTISADGPDFKVELFNDADKPAESLVASGTALAAGGVFALAEANGSRVHGTGKLGSVTASALPASIVAIVSFAVDADVISSGDECENFPGYDSEFGFAFFHAQAMKTILASDLPAVAPQLYKAAPISTFVPISAGNLPDVTAIANPDALRVAQGDLVRWLSTKQKAYLEEWKDIAAQAASDYELAMVKIKDVNAPAESDAASETPAGGVTFGDFTRG